MRNISRLGIIGGEGKMAKLFIPYLEKIGIEILVSDLNKGYKVEELVCKCDAILLSVPLSIFKSLIDELIPLISEDHLLMDFSSLKEMPFKEMKRTKGKVIGLHPLFGPKVRGLKGESIILCDGSDPFAKNWVEEIFRAVGLTVISMSAEKHDRLMACIQALTHCVSLSFADVIRKENALEIGGIRTPLFEKMYFLMKRILSQDSKIYKDIAFYNPYFLPILDEFSKSIDSLKTAIKEKDSAKYFDFFNIARQFILNLEDK